MSIGLESIVASLELCKLIPEGEFEDSALVWRERIGYISSSVGLKFRASEDIGYKSESVKVNYFPAPTLVEIWRELRNLSVNVIDGSITVSCRIDPDETLSETARDDNDVTVAALRLWLRVKGIESK